ncbi:methylated-DNA--[protein]-cysteine S-methyltransferase [Streptomyces sp. 8L]|uniref:methylated-DNA--[protein]-cysteine S-methyltransferase n=1 Tax=Streptomyces sp. 8L TaxID=2877242 RepID=UPI001CD62A5D|nr:methylated-DNA--[protein]-cysteine S-methyltransferase [Streptomyces sp. 8L]MCA1221117.1 methylated-DNA--[protein]-cysteine S-methyltransferase [Streptomyces sp. 8L]
MEHRHTLMDSPLGPLTLVATDGALSGVYMVSHRHMPPAETFGARSDRPFAAVVEQLEAYFRGELRDFDLPVHLAGTDFQRRVWSELTRIPYGQTRSYGQLAAALGQPGASRAVGLANGRNPVSIVVPCHRVVGSTGSLTGYGGGLANKQRLLALESGHADAPADALF